MGAQDFRFYQQSVGTARAQHDQQWISQNLSMVPPMNAKLRKNAKPAVLPLWCLEFSMNDYHLEPSKQHFVESVDGEDSCHKKTPMPYRIFDK